MIEFNNVSKHFDEVIALENINLTIKKNDFFGVIGMSGAGKSTLIRLINGLILPDEGRVDVNGLSLSLLKERELNKLRQTIGMIFQHFNLINQKDVLDNVTLPLKLQGVSKAERKEKGLEMLRLVQLEDKADAYPAQLSGGQKQRVAIARALINDVDILLCDEATSSLDPISTQSILDLLKDLHKKLNLTIVMITHEMKVIQQVCHKMAVLDNGKLVETGRVKDIFTHPTHPKTKELLFVQDTTDFSNKDKPQLRLIFDGYNAFEPIISELVLQTEQAVNILWANTQEVEELVYGQMLIQVPSLSQELLDFLDGRNITYQVEGKL
ncbi:MAG TPA: ATP-binding cassette domain-containing protein [Erysipelothrix sp.]|jgi:D-methionine transport system ATP-binding protein|nr:ATP-binding cassette domain-containing protein [Erysipelothrix sp.]